MGKDNNLHDYLSDLADAIREKKGTTEPINAQSFAEEIRGIETDSPFAVDFGEEIASGNAAYLNALQEDIDYYNEIQRKRANGEVTDDELLNDQEFKERIAYWPKGMTQPSIFSGFYNLRVIELGANVTKFGNYCCVDTLILGGTMADYYGFISGICSVGTVIFKPRTNLRVLGLFSNVFGVKNVDFRNSEHRADGRSILTGRTIWKAVGLDVTQCVELSSFTTNTYNTPELRVLEMIGVGVDLDLSSAKYLYVTSVKYLLDHCQAKAEPYTLSLHTNVKSAFLAKCDEDAEYAASLANANAKGLTLA